MPHIFDRFWTENNNANNNGARGTGVGLSYVKTIIELHGGTIAASSIPREETCFTITFPIDSTSCSAPQDILKQADDADEVSGNNDKEDNSGKNQVLIVEDNPEMMKMLIRLFSPKYEVMKATNGADGLALTKQRLPDIVICVRDYSQLILDTPNGQ